MVTVKLFGMFRLDTGIKELTVDVKTVKELYPVLLAEAKAKNPTTKVTAKDIDGCIVSVNGVEKKKNAPLKDGDVVYLTSPVCGG
ncbi:MAG: MoaD/ThiS family protein [Parasporobacterium sp.]|nr:MoaD/ThiS family protein [Parasporobacterium sp.]